MAGPKVRCAGPASRLPAYQSAGAAGADLHAHLDADLVIPPGGRVLVPTGLSVEIPAGFEGQVRPRSGLAAGHGVTVLNAPGTIDSDYRGEVRVILINLGAEAFRVRHGDRIAQLVVAPIVQADFSRAGAVGDTERGSGGFGSTGT
jgi:dUTP pyrophosphatase